MAAPTTFPGNVIIGGDLSVNGSIGSWPASSITNADIAPTSAIAKTKMALDSLSIFPISFTDFRIHDALQTSIPVTSATDDLALTIGTFGTNAVYIGTGDVKASTITRYARVIVAIPDHYSAADTLSIVCNAAMITNTADDTATLDVQLYQIAHNGATPSADLCTTAATSINSVTPADYSFTITPDDLSPGDLLDIRLAINIVDAATGTAVIGAIFNPMLQCDTRG